MARLNRSFGGDVTLDDVQETLNRQKKVLGERSRFWTHVLEVIKTNAYSLDFVLNGVADTQERRKTIFRFSRKGDGSSEESPSPVGRERATLNNRAVPLIALMLCQPSWGGMATVSQGRASLSTGRRRGLDCRPKLLALVTFVGIPSRRGRSRSPAVSGSRRNRRGYPARRVP